MYISSCRKNTEENRESRLWAYILDNRGSGWYECLIFAEERTDLEGNNRIIEDWVGGVGYMYSVRRCPTLEGNGSAPVVLNGGVFKSKIDGGQHIVFVESTPSEDIQTFFQQVLENRNRQHIH